MRFRENDSFTRFKDHVKKKKNSLVFLLLRGRQWHGVIGLGEQTQGRAVGVPSKVWQK